MQKLYLYLASRSKKGIKIITILQGEATRSKLTDLNSLNLPLVWQQQIGKIIQDNRMLYEPWLESANSYQELKNRLKERGYTELPMGSLVMLNLETNIPEADTSSHKVRATMIRKKKC